jgi:hypothetical protein
LAKLYDKPLGGDPSMNLTGPVPAPDMSLTYRAVLAGMASVRIIELLSAAIIPELVAAMVYSANAPGIAFGLLVPFTGSDSLMDHHQVVYHIISPILRVLLMA